MTKPHWTEFMIKHEDGTLAVKTWEFWRTLLICFFLTCWIGHFLEWPYCITMHSLFGIVSEEYALWNEPWYTPYWVYGIGAVFMTFLLEPFKERFIQKRKTRAGALFQTFFWAVIIAAVLETVIGLLINQPDPVTGIYPFWDNSKFIGNILGQGWIVNDIVIGVVAVVYLWVIYPGISWLLQWMGDKWANVTFAVITALFATACLFCYVIFPLPHLQ